MDRHRLSRRRLLAVAASGSALSATLAGCLGESDGGSGDDGADDENGTDDAADNEDVVEIITREGDDDADEPNFVFDPDHLEIELGTTVRWVNTDGVFHTVTSTDSLEEKSPSGLFDETLSNDGDEFEWTPEEEGVQHYYCEPHAGFMDGTIEVGDVGADETDADEGDEEDTDDAEIDEEFVDMTGEDSIVIETRAGDDDEGEPNFVFDPAFVRLDEGTTVQWINTDGVFHTVTSTDSIDNRSGGGDEFDATIASEGETFEWDAEEPGTQPYYCSPHAGFMYGALEIE